MNATCRINFKICWKKETNKCTYDHRTRRAGPRRDSFPSKEGSPLRPLSSPCFGPLIAGLRPIAPGRRTIAGVTRIGDSILHFSADAAILSLA